MKTDRYGDELWFTSCPVLRQGRGTWPRSSDANIEPRMNAEASQAAETARETAELLRAAAEVRRDDAEVERRRGEFDWKADEWLRTQEERSEERRGGEK